jgi:Homeobox KN domain
MHQMKMDNLSAKNIEFECEGSAANAIRGRTLSFLSSGSSTSSNNNEKRKSSSLRSETVDYLKAWMMSPEHIAHPYPTEQEKAKIMADTGIELKQLTNWFVNNRKRYWKPRVEARINEQTEATTTTSSSAPLVMSEGQMSPSSNCVHTITLGNVVSPANVETLLERNVGPYGSPITLSRLGRPVRAVSEHSSYASESGSVGSMSADQDDYSSATPTEEVEQSMVTRTESVNVHVLRPSSGSEPSLEDISILSNVPGERILRSFENCTLSYRFSADCNRKKVCVFVQWEWHVQLRTLRHGIKRLTSNFSTCSGTKPP